MGEVAWAITAWGAEGQRFDESGVRRFHRVEGWQDAGAPPDPGSWERAARRFARFLLTYRGPLAGRLPPRPRASRLRGRARRSRLASVSPSQRHRRRPVLRVGVDAPREYPRLIEAFDTLADLLGGPEAPALRARAAEVREWLGEAAGALGAEEDVPPAENDGWRAGREDGGEDLSCERALRAVRHLLASGAIEAAREAHRQVEDLFVTYGEDGSLAEAPFVPAARAWAGEPWVREGATALWLETLAALLAATGDPGYTARADAAAGALTRWQRPDGRFASVGVRQ